ncbi:MAG TPA: DJ-1/PfpI family protein [Candidatus Dojkabacteria bacterium]|nr:DJ-1/PfpI family protein [Candidatus Dojkabacteria bacterium]
MDVLFVVANNNFQDIEFTVPYEMIIARGCEAVVASGNGGMCKGVFGKEIISDYKLSEVVGDEFDLVIFIGGGGALEQYLDDPKYLSVAKNIGAICVAPMLISDSGVLKDKRFTCWDDGSRTQINHIIKNGGTYVNSSVVVDGNVITANGPDAAEEFGMKLVEVMSSRCK